jgi:conjugal transfer/entry exclusion protein
MRESRTPEMGVAGVDNRGTSGFTEAMKRTLAGGKWLALIGAACLWITPAPEARASGAVAGATEPTQLLHSSLNEAGWLNDAYEWSVARTNDINKLTELIKNNVITESIRAFNELMTAIQMDISEVLGTVQTLFQAPIDLFQTLMDIPMSLWGTVQGLGSGFQQLYDQAMGTFSMIGNMQGLGSGLGDFTSMFEGNGFDGAYDFTTKMNGLRAAVNADFLSSSNVRQRDTELKKWTAQADKAAFGEDTIQLELAQTEIAAAQTKLMYRAEEFQSLDRLDAVAQRVNALKQAEAQAAGKKAETITWNVGTLRL